VAGLLAAALPVVPAANASECHSPSKALGISRVIEIDSTGGPRHGSINYGETGLLRDKEVILTFDDGPYRGRTERILDALDAACTKATFFAVGTMAMAWPKTIRDVAARGHTVAGHTWNHANLGRRSQSAGALNVEKGFAALTAIIGRPVAPFFRFPYLRETKAMKAYLAKRNIAMFSVDIVAGDTSGYGPDRLLRSVMGQLAEQKKGILLFHDIKKATAIVIPRILAALRKGGYKIVHLKPKSGYQPIQALVEGYKVRVAKMDARFALTRGPKVPPPPPISRQATREAVERELANANFSHGLGPSTGETFAWIRQATRWLSGQNRGPALPIRRRRKASSGKTAIRDGRTAAGRTGNPVDDGSNGTPKAKRAAVASHATPPLTRRRKSRHRRHRKRPRRIKVSQKSPGNALSGRYDLVDDRR